MKMELQYLSKKRILVTGGAGFLGRCIVSYLKENGIAGEQVFVSRSSDFDLTDAAQAQAMIARYQPDVVINLAARLGGIGDARQYPASYFHDNFLIGLNVVEACREASVEKLVYIGTVCSYPKVLPAPFREEDLWNGYPEETNAPYGIAKKAIMSYAGACKQQYGFNSVNLLVTNLYGPGDDFREQTSHVIPAIIKKVCNAKIENSPSIVSWGDGSPSRDFVYVKDAAEAVVKAAEYHNDHEPINIGAGVEITIKDLIEKIKNIVGYAGEIVWDTSKPNGQPRRLLDISKAQRFFHFTPRTSFDAGLRETIAWYIENKVEIDSAPPKFETASQDLSAAR